eukprot:417202-Alexandrium_andersonii.AAC.1
MSYSSLLNFTETLVRDIVAQLEEHHGGAEAAGNTYATVPRRGYPTCRARRTASSCAFACAT